MADLERQLRALLAASAQFWPGRRARLDDYYEAYLWAETVEAARRNGWAVKFVNAGPKGDEFTFRMGPGVLSSPIAFTFARFAFGAVPKGELHIGIRVRGDSGVLHEFDVVGFDQRQATLARLHGGDPGHAATRLHVEAKFHRSDLSLGVGRELVGLRADCPSIHPFLVSRARGSDTMRVLIKHYGGTYVHNGFPSASGIHHLRYCLGAAIVRWV